MTCYTANGGEHSSPSLGIKGSERAFELGERPVPLALEVDQSEPVGGVEPHRIVEVIGQRGRLEKRVKHPGSPLEMALGREPSRNLAREGIAA